MKINEVIRKVGDKYRLLSKKGKNLGTYDSKAGAEKREQQVNYFKHVNEVYSDMSTPKDSVYADDFDDLIGKARPVAKINGYTIDKYVDEDKHVSYVVQNPKGKNYLGELTLRFDSKDKFYHSEVFFTPELQGSGLAIELYKYAIVEDGYTIVSDQTQTPGSQKLWEKLAKDPSIFVYKWDPKTNNYSHWDEENTDVHVSVKQTRAKMLDIEKEMDDAYDALSAGQGNRSELSRKYNELAQAYEEIKHELYDLGGHRLVATKS